MSPHEELRAAQITRGSLLRIAAAIGTLALVLVAHRQGWLDPDALEHRVRASGGHGALLFIAAGTLTVSLFLPKTLVSVSAGALFGFLEGTLLMAVIAGLAASCNYAFARWLAGDRLRRLIERDRRLQRVSAVAQSGGFRLQLLLRLAPVHTVLISCAAGLAGVRYLPFLMAAVLGIAGQLLWIYAGTQAGAAAASSQPGVQTISFALAVLSAIALAVYLPRAAMKQLRDS